MNKAKRLARAKQKARINRLRRTGDVQLESLAETARRLGKIQDKQRAHRARIKAAKERSCRDY